MKEETILVKVSYKVDRTNSNIRCDARLNYIDINAKNKNIISGGFCTKDSGYLMFQAKDIEEAKKIAKSSSFIKNRLGRYCDMKYDFVVTPGFN